MKQCQQLLRFPFECFRFLFRILRLFPSLPPLHRLSFVVSFYLVKVKVRVKRNFVSYPYHKIIVIIMLDVNEKCHYALLVF